VRIRAGVFPHVLSCTAAYKRPCASPPSNCFITRGYSWYPEGSLMNGKGTGLSSAMMLPRSLARVAAGSIHFSLASVPFRLLHLDFVQILDTMNMTTRERWNILSGCVSEPWRSLLAVGQCQLHRSTFKVTPVGSCDWGNRRMKVARMTSGLV